MMLRSPAHSTSCHCQRESTTRCGCSQEEKALCETQSHCGIWRAGGTHHSRSSSARSYRCKSAGQYAHFDPDQRAVTARRKCKGSDEGAGRHYWRWGEAIFKVRAGQTHLAAAREICSGSCFNKCGGLWPLHACDRRRELTTRNCLFGLGLCISVALSATCAVAQPEDRWVTVSDPGLQVQYPSGVFSVLAGPTERYSGRRFTRPDGSAQFAYYSFENSRGKSPANFLRRLWS